MRCIFAIQLKNCCSIGYFRFRLLFIFACACAQTALGGRKCKQTTVAHGGIFINMRFKAKDLKRLQIVLIELVAKSAVTIPHWQPDKRRINLSFKKFAGVRRISI